MMQFIKQHYEVVIWTSALAYFAIVDPFAQQQFSFCPLFNLGIDFCPGCGLGHSIAHLLHGNLEASFTSHILGIPALVILLHRIIQLLSYRFSRPRKFSASHSKQEPPCQT
ncbi:MAG: DUF2752 domain-containing protein [Bacteroidota bacterium]|jgi:hypothetical protein